MHPVTLPAGLYSVPTPIYIGAGFDPGGAIVDVIRFPSGTSGTF